MCKFFHSRRQSVEYNIHKNFKDIWGSSSVKVFFVLCAVAASLAAQETPADSAGSGGITRRITGASQFFDHDFVNVYVFGNGSWDSRVPVLSSNQTSFGNSLGWEAGGGITLTHTFKGGDVTLNYRGSYRDYQSAGFSGGNQQSLSLGFNKRLNRRWTFGANVNGGILSYGSSFYSPSAVGVTVAANPFSLESRFVDAGVSLSYEQTRRLSYVFSGDYFLSNYANSISFSSRGVSGSASVLYRTTARTTVGATYSRSYYKYSQNAGDSTIDGGSLSLSHRFVNHWQLDLSGGVNRSHSKGVINVPISTIFNGQLVTGYYIGPYDRTLYSPSFQGVLTHYYRRSLVSIGGGQSILAGNGLYLSSRDLFANGTYSYSTRRSNFSLGSTYARLSSIANTVTQVYSTEGASAGYGVNLVRYLSANFRYDFLHYDDLFAFGGLNEHRVSFGLSLSSKSVPLTLF